MPESFLSFDLDSFWMLAASILLGVGKEGTMQLTAATREPELLEEDHKMDDLSLVARAREGDQTAFYELVRRH
jgi:hypothetical protein